jgi:sugar lactone lactonase YvrE
MSLMTSSARRGSARRFAPGRQSLAIAAVALGAVMVVGGVAIARSSPKPVLRTLAVSPGSIPASGGIVRIKVRAAHATACVIASSPAINGLPKTISCRAGLAHFSLPIRSNPHAFARRFRLSARAVHNRFSSPASYRWLTQAAARPPRLATPIFSLTPGPTSVTLNFSAVAHASGYDAQVCKSPGGGCAAALIPVTPGSESFVGLLTATTYAVKLTAIGNGKTYLDSPTGFKTATTGLLDIAPTGIISGSNTGLNGSTQLAVGPDGTVYVTNDLGNSITSYAPGSNGNVTPARTIVGPSTSLSSPQGIGVDATGTIYVAQANGSVLGFPTSATGNIGPSTALTGLGDAAAIAIDSLNNLYVSQYPVGPAAVFFPGNRNGLAAPNRTVPGLVSGIGTDASNNLYAVDYSGSAIKVYAAGTSNIIRTISGPNTQLSNPSAVEVDNSGRVYVTNDVVERITVYPPHASGNVTPIAVISGPNTGMSHVGGFGFAPDESIVVADYGATNQVLTFAPLFAP